MSLGGEREKKGGSEKGFWVERRVKIKLAGVEVDNLLSER
jgi:hypothetical protein